MMWHPFKWTVVVVEDLKQITNYIRLMNKNSCQTATHLQKEN